MQSLFAAVRGGIGCLGTDGSVTTRRTLRIGATGVNPGWWQGGSLAPADDDRLAGAAPSGYGPSYGPGYGSGGLAIRRGP